MNWRREIQAFLSVQFCHCPCPSMRIKHLNPSLHVELHERVYESIEILINWRFLIIKLWFSLYIRTRNNYFGSVEVQNSAVRHEQGSPNEGLRVILWAAEGTISKTVEEIIPDMWKKVKKNWWESVVSAFDVLKYFSIDFSWLLHSLVLLMAGLEWSILDLPSYLGMAHRN